MQLQLTTTMCLGMSLFYAGASSACDCASQTIKKAFETSDVIFSGLAISATLDAKKQIQIFTFKVDRVWKGTKQSTLAIEDHIGSDCLYGFKSGIKYLVYANLTKGKLRTTHCSRTMPYDAAAGEMSDLDQQGKSPNPSR